MHIHLANIKSGQPSPWSYRRASALCVFMCLSEAQGGSVHIAINLVLTGPTSHCFRWRVVYRCIGANKTLLLYFIDH